MHTKEIDNGRVQYIDIAKGIAIICIILGHLGSYQINRVVFTFHVPIFFLITGYFVNNNQSFGSFVKHKVRTLLVPYITICVITALFWIIIGAFHNTDKSNILNWIYAIVYGAGEDHVTPFFIKGIGAIWFLLATFWGSVLLRKSLDLNKYVRMLTITLLFFAAIFSARYVWLPFSIQAGACSAFFMYIGYLIRNSKELLKQVSLETKVFCSIIFLIVWIAFIVDFQTFWLVHCDIGRGIVDVISCICACCSVFLIAFFISKKAHYLADVLSFFGKYSLFVLCCHFFELELPWWKVSDYLSYNGFSFFVQILFIACLKLVLDLSATFILSKFAIVKKVFGMRT